MPNFIKPLYLTFYQDLYNQINLIRRLPLVKYVDDRLKATVNITNKVFVLYRSATFGLLNIINFSLLLERMKGEYIG